ncbi:uncharacterized protein LOC119283959 [Triticum dicoccoides]|uniref:uncharacterized protein LOC119283959 n=1 Tax=Triticum dicoccoides TaxID=85692 RepID=UPI00188F6F06|nr:uncharacterized protein LOC119283959 [Triticum dicoccoides]
MRPSGAATSWVVGADAHLYDDLDAAAIPALLGSCFDGDNVDAQACTSSSSPRRYPKWKVGVIIGNAGETIKHIQLHSGAKIQVTRDMDVQPGSRTRLADLSGTPDQISRAEQLISDVFAKADAGSFGTISSCVEQFQMQIANNKLGDRDLEPNFMVDCEI